MAEAASRAGGVRLVTDDLELVVLPELGARLHRLRVFGHDLLRTPDDADQHRVEPFWWGGYVMAPWCNRLEAVPVEVAGRTVALASNFPDGTAIHGQVYRQPWRLDAEAIELVAAGGWPGLTRILPEARPHSTNDLHVLLRHRQPSIRCARGRVQDGRQPNEKREGGAR